MATRMDDSIRLAGPPQRTSAVVLLPAGGARVAKIALELPGGITIQKAYLRPSGGDATEVRLRLPRETPPGSYRGELALGDRKTTITIDVEPVRHLRVQPQRTRLALPPNAVAEFGVTIENRGNVSFEIPDSVALELDDDDGQEHALGRSLRAELAPGERRVDRFFEELRAEHGGEAKVVVLAGAGPLQPAEGRTVQCRLELPDTARPGRRYTGGWQLGDTGHLIEVEVNDAIPVIREGRRQ